MLPVANVAKNPPRVMFCIHINTANGFLHHQAKKKKKVVVNVAKNTHL
jgi:hypothetical protein